MTKLEELSTLLVNEIEDFNKGIEKLEAINREMSNTKIQMDLTEYKTIIEQHQQKMNEQISAQERFESRFNDRLKRAKIYPNWAVIVFVISLLFSLASIIYAYHVKSNAIKDEQIAFEKGVADYDNHIKVFFSENEKAKKQYEQWNNQLGCCLVLNVS